MGRIFGSLAGWHCWIRTAAGLIFFYSSTAWIMVEAVSSCLGGSYLHNSISSWILPGFVICHVFYQQEFWRNLQHTSDIEK